MSMQYTRHRSISFARMMASTSIVVENTPAMKSWADLMEEEESESESVGKQSHAKERTERENWSQIVGKR